MFPRTAARCLEADAGLVQWLRAELGDTRIIGAVRWSQVMGGEPGDDLYFGTVGFGIHRSPARLELALGYGAIVQLDAWLSRADDPARRRTFFEIVMDPRLNEIDLDRPTAPVLDFARRLASCWLAIAGGGALVLDDDAPSWRPIEVHRELGPMSETWHGRSFAFDAHLSQLMSEPLGILELIAPTTVLDELESLPRRGSAW